jgi:hypothetical protein
VDGHARRVCQPLLDAWSDFVVGKANLLDLSRLAEQAYSALDNASAPLLLLLHRAAGDLEYAYFAVEREDHQQTAQDIIAPVLAAFDTAA